MCLDAASSPFPLNCAFVHAVEWALRNKKDIFTMTEKEIRSIPGLQDPLKLTVHTYEWKNGKRVEKTHVSHKPLSEYVITMRSQESVTLS